MPRMPVSFAKFSVGLNGSEHHKGLSRPSQGLGRGRRRSQRASDSTILNPPLSRVKMASRVNDDTEFIGNLPMPKPADPDKNTPPAEIHFQAEKVLSFEQAMADLQQIVADLEDNSLGLESSLAQFERGIGLLRNCHSFLEQAEQKIEILVGFKANGEPTTAPFDATPTAGTSDPKTLF